MLRTYIDDSGSSPTDSTFILGGLIATAGRWEAFVDEWHYALHKDPAIDYFKSTEARYMRGQFGAGWNRSLIDQRVDELSGIAVKYAQYRVHVIMQWDDFNKYIKDIGDRIVEKFSASYSNPYMICFFATVMAINKYREIHNISGEMDYIFDEQGKYGELSAKLMEIVRYGDLRRLIDNVPMFRDDKKVLPLQAADMYTWNVP